MDEETRKLILDFPPRRLFKAEVLWTFNQKS